MPQQDPLAQLKDIHLPPDIIWWPLAPGWWILIALLASLIGIGVWKWLHHRRTHAYKRQAQSELQALKSQYSDNPNLYCQQLSQLLRRVALMSFPQQQVASLTGHDWLSFLDKTGKTTAFMQGAGQELITVGLQGKNNASIEVLHSLSTQWIKNHQ